MIASYLTVERQLGRIAADGDVDTLAPTLIGAGHLLFAGREGIPPEAAAIRKVVATIIAGVVPEPPPPNRWRGARGGRAAPGGGRVALPGPPRPPLPPRLISPA